MMDANTISHESRGTPGPCDASYEGGGRSHRPPPTKASRHRVECIVAGGNHQQWHPRAHLAPQQALLHIVQGAVVRGEVQAVRLLDASPKNSNNEAWIGEVHSGSRGARETDRSVPRPRGTLDHPLTGQGHRSTLSKSIDSLAASHPLHADAEDSLRRHISTTARNKPISAATRVPWTPPAESHIGGTSRPPQPPPPSTPRHPVLHAYHPLRKSFPPRGLVRPVSHREDGALEPRRVARRVIP